MYTTEGAECQNWGKDKPQRWSSGHHGSGKECLFGFLWFLLFGFRVLFFFF